MRFRDKKIVIFILSFSIYLISLSSWSLNIQEGTVSVSGGHIWYQIISQKKTAHNPPLLILHGGPGIPHDYLNVFRKIANDRPVIFYDQLGCGHSSVKNNNNQLWRIEKFESDLEILIHHLHLKNFHLLGHSWGGALAAKYALKHPSSISTLTLASPLLSTQRWVEDSRQLLETLPKSTQSIIITHEKAGTTDSAEYQEAVNVYYQHFVCRMNPWPKDLSDAFAHLNQNIYNTMWGPSEFTMTGNLKDFDILKNLNQLSLPVLITGGKFDEATPETLSQAVNQLSNGRYILYQSSAHLAFLEEESKYLADLRLFLKEHDEMQK